MAVFPEALLEITVNRYDIEPVIERNQNISNYKIPEQVSENNLHIAKLGTLHPSGNGNKRNSRKRCADHTKSHYIPG